MMAVLLLERPCTGQLLGYRLRHWPNIEPALGGHIVCICGHAAPSHHDSLPSVEWILASAGDCGPALNQHWVSIVLICLVGDFSSIILYITLLCITLLCIALLCIALLHCIALHCTALHCTALHCTVLYCTVLYCIVLYCTVLYCIVLYCIVLYCIVLYCIVVWCCAVLCCAAVDLAKRTTWATFQKWSRWSHRLSEISHYLMIQSIVKWACLGHCL